MGLRKSHREYLLSLLLIDMININDTMMQADELMDEEQIDELNDRTNLNKECIEILKDYKHNR